MNAKTRRQVIRRTSAAVGTTTLVVVLAGCAQEVPQPEAPPEYTGPMLSVEQEAGIIEDVAASIDAATEELDPEKLKDRVTGPALQVRSGEIALADAQEDGSGVTEIPSTSALMVLPTTQTWPRTSINITDRTEDLGVNRMVAYRQDSAREDYRMWTWVQLIPGTILPNFADPEVIGSAAVAADDDSLVATPQDALAQYADLVGKGTDDSEHAAAFELPSDTDDLVKRVQADAKNLREDEDFQEADGSVRVAYAPMSGLVAVRTSDGGAVVMGALDGNVRLTSEDDAELAPVTATQKALIGDKDPTNELYVEYTDQVALYIPPAGSDALIQPIGYTHTATAADTSIPEKRNTDRE
ncbi:hypothetical protein ACNHYB_15720 [Isoptericola jiangsuensis]|uniref:hypothetical protein n=1 Tax=Isoptericola jiangsuensis TaxID=548579 RepID=UPI003AACF4D6